MMNFIKVTFLPSNLAVMLQKEVYSCATALQNGYEKFEKNGLLTNTSILEIQKTLEENSAGFRKLPGTVLKNDRTGEVAYSPPEDQEQIRT